MSNIGNPTLNAEFPVDTFFGNGGTDYLLSIAVPGPTALDVDVDAAGQDPLSSYYIYQGKTLRFYEAIEPGAKIVAKYKGLMPSVAIYNKLPFIDYTGAIVNIPLTSNMYLPFQKADGSFVNINLASV